MFTLTNLWVILGLAVFALLLAGLAFLRGKAGFTLRVGLALAARTGLLAVALVLGLAGCEKAQNQAAAPEAGFDYLRDVYPELGGDHVFDTVTLERLVRILETDGTSLVVLASPLNETSRAALPLINQAAKEQGIQKIYHFDPHLGFDPAKKTRDGVVDASQKGIVDIVADTDKPYSQFWKTLTAYEPLGESNADNKYLSANYRGKGPLLRHIDAAYTSGDTLLLAYNRAAGTPAGQGGTVFAQDGAEILASLLVKDAASVKDAEFKTGAVSVLSRAVINNTAAELRLGQFEYFESWPYSGAAASPITGAHYDNFNLQSVTYPELAYLLRAPGTHNILFSGSWCPDSRAAIGYIAENAAKFDVSTVYVFDFRLDGNTGAAFNFTVNGTEYAYTTGNLSIFNGDAKSPYALDSELLPVFTGHLGARVIEAFGKFNTGNNVARPYYPDGDGTKNLVLFSGAKTRSPYLAQYDKDAPRGVAGEGSHITREWLHEIKDWEAPFSNAEREQAVGDLVDYEFASGDLTAAQKAAGRAALGTFFSGAEIAYGPGKITINEAGGDLDSGCGDDNDPIINSGDAVLIPNHGTGEYDVERYDIHITFDPSKANAKDAFTGKTVIYAKNTKADAAALDTIYLDFRKQAISSVTVDGIPVSAKTGALSAGTYQQSNEDSRNYQKLVIKPARPIAAGAAFTVEVSYSTGFIDTFVAAGESTQGFSKSRTGIGGAALGEPFGSTYWFPNNNTPADGAFYTISLTAPSSYTGVASGNRTGKTTRDNLTTTVWELDSPTAPYQVFAAISNDYLEFSSQGAGLFQLNKITAMDGRELDVFIYVNKTIYNANLNRARDKIDLFINKLPFYIRELEKIAGPYPGSSAGFVFDDLSDGQGDSAGWGAVETKDRPFYTSSGVTPESTFVHEYAHQWFGNSVRPSAWKDLWLNEGFATYVTDLFYENTQGINARTKYENLFNSTGGSSALWAAATADIKNESDLFGGVKPAYNRGALTLASLRVSAGDGAFFTILRNWNNPDAGGFKGKAAETGDFISFARKQSGKNLDAFFRAWLYTPSKPAEFEWSLN